MGKFLFGNEIAVRATGLKAKIIIIDPAAAVRIRSRFLIVTNPFDATKVTRKMLIRMVNKAIKEV